LGVPQSPPRMSPYACANSPGREFQDGFPPTDFTDSQASP
jgi:hypothetical protein